MNRLTPFYPQPKSLADAQIRGILSGAITQFKIPLKEQPSPHVATSLTHAGITNFYTKKNPSLVFDMQICPYGAIGDHLYVQETTLTIHHANDPAYRADYIGQDAIFVGRQNGGWTAPIHMPRHLCRIELLITNVDCQKLSITPTKKLWHWVVDFKRVPITKTP